MIKHILFDLDDTLYPTSLGLMKEIGDRMNEFMIAHVGIPVSEVQHARQDYWNRYGTTLRGLYIERHIDAQAFLKFVHDVPVENYLRPDPRLDEMLAQLSAQKFVFTNATGDYAERVLRALGVERHFTRIFDINFIRYESKPTPIAYSQVLDALGARADECMMVDDLTRNLAPAKKLGMRTVLLDGNPANRTEHEDGADVVIPTIYDLLEVVNK